MMPIIGWDSFSASLVTEEIARDAHHPLLAAITSILNDIPPGEAVASGKKRRERRRIAVSTRAAQSTACLPNYTINLQHNHRPKSAPVAAAQIRIDPIGRSGGVWVRGKS